MEPLRPNEQRAKTAILLIWIAMALEVISLVSAYFQYSLLLSTLDGNELSMDTATANDLREQIIAVIYTIVYIISGITFILWFRRAYYNLSLRANRLSFSDGMAAGGWFIPLINLWRPYQIMKELYEETLLVLAGNSNLKLYSFTTGKLGWWWALWIINGIASQISFRLSLHTDTVYEIMDGTIAGMISNIIGIPLAIITVYVIKDYAAVEPLLNEIRDAEVPPPLQSESETTNNIILTSNE